MTTNDYQWIPITTNDYQRLSERYQKDYLKRSIDIRWLFNPLLSLILRLSCFEKLTPLEPFSTPMILLLSFYGNISKKNSPCISSFKGCSSVKQLFAKVWFMFMIVTWRKDSLTSSTWFIHVYLLQNQHIMKLCRLKEKGWILHAGMETCSIYTRQHLPLNFHSLINQTDDVAKSRIDFVV